MPEVWEALDVGGIKGELDVLLHTESHCHETEIGTSRKVGRNLAKTRWMPGTCRKGRWNGMGVEGMGGVPRAQAGRGRKGRWNGMGVEVPKILDARSQLTLSKRSVEWDGSGGAEPDQGTPGRKGRQDGMGA
jgi:hypothetical protein